MSKYNFFERVTVSSVWFEDVELSWGFNSAGIALLNENTTSGRIIEYSFDGVNVHGTLDPDLPSAGIVFDNRHECKIWLRLSSNGTSCIVRVEVWG
jgi:hypothetical protein